jgi:hypothetical protein
MFLTPVLLHTYIWIIWMQMPLTSSGDEEWDLESFAEVSNHQIGSPSQRFGIHARPCSSSPALFHRLPRDRGQAWRLATSAPLRLGLHRRRPEVPFHRAIGFCPRGYAELVNCARGGRRLLVRWIAINNCAMGILASLHYPPWRLAMVKGWARFPWSAPAVSNGGAWILCQAPARSFHGWLFRWRDRIRSGYFGSKFVAPDVEAPNQFNENLWYRHLLKGKKWL